MVERKQHLIVVDVQNDFCDTRGFFPTHFGLDIKDTEGIVDRISKALRIWRSKDLPVIFTQAIGDPYYLSRTQFKRYDEMGKLGFLKDGSWGADFYRLKPEEKEHSFKKGGYDPFFNSKFKDHILQNASQLVLCGFFSDVCIDATVRTADQLGIETYVLEDCSKSMFHSHEQALKFMQTYYGTKVINLIDLAFIIYDEVKSVERKEK